MKKYSCLLNNLFWMQFVFKNNICLTNIICVTPIKTKIGFTL